MIYVLLGDYVYHVLCFGICNFMISRRDLRTLFVYVGLLSLMCVLIITPKSTVY